MSEPEKEIEGADVVLRCSRVEVGNDGDTEVEFSWPGEDETAFEMAGSYEDFKNLRPGSYYRVRFFETEKPAEETETATE